MNRDHEEIARALEVLGLDDPVSLREIRAAYRNLSRRYHPDTGGSRGEVGQDHFLELQRSYEFLVEYCENYHIELLEKDEEKAEYDHLKRFYDGWLGHL